MKDRTSWTGDEPHLKNEVGLNNIGSVNPGRQMCYLRYGWKPAICRGSSLGQSYYTKQRVTANYCVSLRTPGCRLEPRSNPMDLGIVTENYQDALYIAHPITALYQENEDAHLNR